MNLELTEDDLKVIHAGLGKLPLEVAIQVYGKIQQQMLTQQREEAEPDVV